MNQKDNRPWLTPATMRRAFQSRLLSVDPRAKRVLAVTIERIGGFEDKSYKLRYHLSLRLRSGRIRRLVLRGSSEQQDQTRRQAYVIMRFLWLRGFSAGPRQVARPVTFFWRWRLLVYEETPGRNLLSVLRQPGVQAKSYLQRTAGWLAELHRHSPRTIKLAYNQAGRKQYWQMALRLLSLDYGPQNFRLRRHIDQVMRFEDQLARGRHRVLVHHDFHLANILTLPQVIRVVDFTESRLSSPLVDLATFLTQLELQLSATVRPETVARWQKIFLTAYRRHQPRLRLETPVAKRIFRFIRFRIALQSFLATHLFGRQQQRWQQEVLSAHWYYG